MSLSRKSKMLSKLNDAFDRCHIQSGALLSFHHHLRNGDGVLNQVLEVARDRGLKDLGIAISSIFPVHAPLADHIESGLVDRIWTSYISGPVAQTLLLGHLKTAAIIQSHGGRASALQKGTLKPDVAFIAAPSCDATGALSGGIGISACGPLGYAMVDAQYAKTTVALVEELSPDEWPFAEIPAKYVDFIVKLPSIGNANGILSGTTSIGDNNEDSPIIRNITAIVEASGLLKNGFSFQTGAGKTSLACVSAIGALMRNKSIVGRFISGGICKSHVDLLEQGLFERIYDVQCFDPQIANHFVKDERHIAMSALTYASPLDPDNIADQLDIAILGLSEIDRHFNVNVTTAGSGMIIGGPGGHPDISEGAKVTILSTKLTAQGFAKVVPQVQCITTKGQNVDILVTDYAVSVNPQRQDLIEKLTQAGITILPIDMQVEKARSMAEFEPTPAPTGRIIASLFDRHGLKVDDIRTNKITEDFTS